MKKSKSIEWNKVTPLSKYLAMALFIALPFIGFILGMKYKSLISISSSAPVSSSAQYSTNVVRAGVFIPTINDRLKDEWTAYINWDYGFSFLIPTKWKIDLADDNMTINGLRCMGCVGGFYGIAITYHKNDNRLPLRDFISKLDSYHNDNNLELYETKNPKITTYIDRQTPGAAPGQTAYIFQNITGKIVELYCGSCSDVEMNYIVSTFDFETERDEKAPWISFQ